MQKKFFQNWRRNILDKYKVKINHRAIRELNAIYDYIAKEKLSPEYAKRQADRIKSAILDLSTFPQSHQERNTGKYAGKGYRQLLMITMLPYLKLMIPIKPSISLPYNIKDEIYKKPENHRIFL